MVSIEQDQGGRDKEASQLGPAAAAAQPLRAAAQEPGRVEPSALYDMIS